MEDNFSQNDFEEFLQDQVRNHRMYPSDAVWREIDKKLHGEKRWPALTIAASLLLSATVLICVYFTPKPSIFSLQPANNPAHQSSSKNSSAVNDFTAVAPFKSSRSNVGIAPATPTPATNQISINESVASSQPPAAAASSFVNNSVKLASAVQTEAAISNPSTAAQIEQQAAGNLQLVAVVDSDRVVTNEVKVNADGSTLPATKDGSDKNMVDGFLKDHKEDVALHTQDKKNSVKNKFSYQIYVAPSVSYRKLLEDNSIEKPTNNSGPIGLNYVADVNKVVRHKPGAGIELGVNFMYNLSNKVRVKSGLQFNMRQYSIEAYRSATELASIALIGSNGIDTVNTMSIYRNNNGYSSAELVNRYYQVSMPIGIEWEILGNKKIQLNVAASIQPTYLLNRNAYLLSTNFKNYTESPDMVRQWNINSNIETFISFKVGDFKWQLGPQLRYQPYSTFIPQYSIKEHLMDYGVKLGVSQIIK